MPVVDLLVSSTLAFVITATILGLLIGSFLNVVIHRIPLIMQRDWERQCHELMDSKAPTQSTLTLSRPRSRCPDCGKAIPALDNIPILSYLILGGRCRACRAPISIRYPLIELLTGVLSAIVAAHFGFSWACLGALLLTWLLIALTFIDVDKQLLPDNLTLPLLWMGLVFNLFNVFTDLTSAVIGAISGYMALWLVYQLFRLITGKEGMGYGDFKLLAALGAWLGWQFLPVIIILSSLVGAVLGICLILFKQHQHSQPIPFGPYLAAAGWLALIWGEQLNHAYLRLAGLA
ncbi:Leader peptidase (Prepilin peptidase) / N-methyltransferase [Methylophaga frappieri]|uniref:Prepilin leader peptidase/N-methyltransferase n=1 Tax=Methylophaga frappieri (strain ATCC BAA-2434 / DSM 25690 / JAM7) TaxID=754477 RepID=I1YKB9_METFJ|nr:A24 family peptidase [Methylophaga frappieri]AFJ03362.1 Leader peptidase (Prepilin peptidase) / N-methyltransferase [Methylophaga frappieri]